MLFKICNALDITVVEFLSIEPYVNRESFNSDNLGLNDEQMEKLKVFIKSLKEEQDGVKGA